MMGLIKSLFEVKELIILGVLMLVLVGATFYVGDKDYITARTLANQISYMSSINSGDKIELNLKTKEDYYVSSSSENEFVVEKKENDEIKVSVTKNYIGNSKITMSGNYILIS